MFRVDTTLGRAATAALVALGLLTLAAIQTGCPDETTTPTPTCTEGTLECPCTSAGTCDGALVCENNMCIIGTSCEEGTDGCPCYANGTCNSGLECNASNECAAPVEPGELGDPCDADRPCGTHTDGTQLECTDGTCQLPVVCTPGTLGCPCDNGSCGSDGGVQLECSAGTCIDPGNCPEGTQGCPCGAGDTCDSGLMCQGAVCIIETPPDAGISIGNADVRSCSMVFDLADVTANFAGQAIGRTKRKGSRLAVSFIASSDAAFDGPVATLLDSAGMAVDLTSVTPTTVECFDRLGASVSDPALSLN